MAGNASKLVAAVAMSLVMLVFASPTLSAEKSLTKGQVDKLEQVVVPAYQAGSSLEVLKGLAPLVARMSTDEIKQADALLKKHDVPAVAHLLAEARLALMLQDLPAQKMPRANRIEALLVLPVLHQHVAKGFQEINAHPAWNDPEGKQLSLDDYRGLLNTAGALNSQLSSAGRATRGPFEAGRRSAC